MGLSPKQQSPLQMINLQSPATQQPYLSAHHQHQPYLSPHPQIQPYQSPCLVPKPQPSLQPEEEQSPAPTTRT